MAEQKVRVCGGRKKKQLTPEEKAEKQAKLKEQAREAAKTKKKKDDLDLGQESKSIAQIIEEKASQRAIEIVENKTKAIKKKIKDGRKGKGRPTSGMREYEKFSCEKLIAIFGGWFTLSYLFTVKNDDKEQTETDFYIASQDVSMMRANERPKVNQVIKQQFGKTVYGFAIIAPVSAFE